MAPRTATISRSADLAPAGWSGPPCEASLIRATARVVQQDDQAGTAVSIMSSNGVPLQKSCDTDIPWLFA